MGGRKDGSDTSPPAAGAAPGWEARASGSGSWRRLPSPVHLHLVSAGLRPAALDVSDALDSGRSGHCSRWVQVASPGQPYCPPPPGRTPLFTLL